LHKLFFDNIPYPYPMGIHVKVIPTQHWYGLHHQR
jgi:hypothetical protein